MNGYVIGNSMKVNDIPVEKVKTDSGFYSPAASLIAAVREYYQREHGVQVSDKDLEDQIIKIVRIQK